MKTTILNNHLCSDTTLSHPHPLLSAGVPATPQKSPPLPLTTRNSCEAKPCCLLKPPIKIFYFILFFNLGFGKILAEKNFRQHNGCILDNSKSCIHPIYTISKYMATNIPSHAYNTKLCTYICSIIHNQSFFLT